MHAIVPSICHDDAPTAVDSDIPGVLKLTVSISSTSDGAQASPITETQHLHAMIFGICNNNVAIAVHCNSIRAAELAVAAAFRAE